MQERSHKIILTEPICLFASQLTVVGVSNEKMKMKFWNRPYNYGHLFLPQISRFILRNYPHISRYTNNAVEKASLKNPDGKSTN
jgi:hypothetical protein